MIIINRRATIIVNRRARVNISSATAGGPFVVGFNSQGGSNDTIGSLYPLCMFTPNQSGVINSLKSIVRHDFGGGDSVSMAVYSNSSGSPSSLLFYASTPFFLSDGSIQTASFSSFTLVNGTLAVTNGVPLWIALWTDFGGGVSYFYDVGTTGQTATVTTLETAFNWINTISGVDPLDRKMSVWAECS